jgi:hypothetical protein
MTARIIFIIVAIIFILGAICFAWMMTEYNQQQVKCAEEHGGKVVVGYCTYVENGTSKSYDIWHNNSESEDKTK